MYVAFSAIALLNGTVFAGDAVEASFYPYKKWLPTAEKLVPGLVIT